MVSSLPEREELQSWFFYSSRMVWSVFSSITSGIMTANLNSNSVFFGFFRIFLK